MEKPCCPRCGYDLSGAVTSWKDCCPLSGVCSECGLKLEWAMVVDVRRRRPQWLVEHAPGWRAAAKASLRNGLGALDGRGWWRRVRLEHDVRAGRLLLHWAVWSAVAHAAMTVIGVVAATAGVLRHWQRSSAPQGGWSAPWTDHLLATVNQAALYPWGTLSDGYAGMRITVWSGLDLAIGGAVACAAMGGGFLLLPLTMGKLDIRRRHIVRGVGYSASVFAASVVVITIGARAMEFLATYLPLRSEVGTFGVHDRVVVLVAAVAVWWGCWWWRFAKDYLRLPRAQMVVALLTVLALLAALVVARTIEEWLARLIADVRYALWARRTP